MDNVIKRILMVPTSTPREALYIETIMQQKRITMRCRLEKTKNETITATMDVDEIGTWKNQTDLLIRDLEITDEPNTNLLHMKKNQQKIIIREATTKNLHKRITASKETKSKINHLITGHQNEWKAGIRQPYMNQLNRFQASSIFKARTRMLDIKNNFRGKYPDLICRGCGQADETQEHILNECPGIHTNDETKILTNEIFTDDPGILKETYKKIIRIEKKLS